MDPIQPVVLLNQSDIDALLSYQEAVTIVEQAFSDYAAHTMIMPSKVYLEFPNYNGDFRAMPAGDLKSGTACLKWVNSHANNPMLHLPSVMAILLLNDAKTGLPLAIMDATRLTSLRTGAARAVAAKYLARPDSEIASFVGAGAQAITQASALLQVTSLKAIRVVDLNETPINTFKQSVSQIFDGNIETFTDIQDCISPADIITTTTSSRKPVIRDDWIKAGTHINAIGADAPGKQELDPALLQRSVVVVDDLEQATHSGEINLSIASGDYSQDSIAACLGDIVSGHAVGRYSPDDITIFDSTGLAIQDLSCANFVYQKARDRKNLNSFSFLE